MNSLAPTTGEFSEAICPKKSLNYLFDFYILPVGFCTANESSQLTSGRHEEKGVRERRNTVSILRESWLFLSISFVYASISETTGFEDGRR